MICVYQYSRERASGVKHIAVSNSINIVYGFLLYEAVI